MCAVAGACRRPGFGEEGVLTPLRDMMRGQDNRGSEGLGISFWNHMTGGFTSRYSNDAARNNPDLLASRLSPTLNGLAGLGHIRYRTSGAIKGRLSLQPMNIASFYDQAPANPFEISFNGTIANADELRVELQQLGIHFRGKTDTEVLIRLIEQIRAANTPQSSAAGSYNYESIFRELDRRIDGGCSLCLLDSNGDMVSYRNNPGIRPLWFAQAKNGLLLTACETSAFEELQSSIDGKYQQIPPGEIVQFTRAEDRIDWKFVGKPSFRKGARPIVQPHLDALEPIYFMRATSEVRDGWSASKTRFKLGQAAAHLLAPQIQGLSREDRGRSRVVAIPSTGIPYAEGFEQASGLHKTDAIEGRTRGRVFLMATGHKRLEMAGTKHTLINEKIAGKKNWMIDDSAVRGDQMRIITRKLFEGRINRAEQANWVIGSSPIIGIDCYGIALPSLEELAFWQVWQQTNRHERYDLYERNKDGIIVNLELFEKKLAQKLRAEVLHDMNRPPSAIAEDAITIRFLPLKTLKETLPGKPEDYSFHVFDANYPTLAGQAQFDRALERLQKLNAA